MTKVAELSKRFQYTGCGMVFDVVFELVGGTFWTQTITNLPDQNVLEKILMPYGNFHQIVHNLYQPSVDDVPLIKGTTKPNPKCVLYNHMYFMKTLWEHAFTTITGVLEMIQKISPDEVVDIIVPAEWDHPCKISYRQISPDEIIITKFIPPTEHIYNDDPTIGQIYTKADFMKLKDIISNNHFPAPLRKEDCEEYQSGTDVPKKESATVRMTVSDGHRQVTMDDHIVLIYRKLSENKFVVTYCSPVLYHEHFTIGYVYTENDFALLIVSALDQVAAALYNAQIEKTEKLPENIKEDEISQQPFSMNTDTKNAIYYAEGDFPDFNVTVFDVRETAEKNKRDPVIITYRNTGDDHYIIVNATTHFPKLFISGKVLKKDIFHEKIKYLAECQSGNIALSKIQNNGISGIGKEGDFYNPPVFYAELDHDKSNKETVTVLKWNGLDMQSLPFESQTSGKPYCYIHQMALHVGVGQNLFVYRDGEMSLFKFRELTEIMDRMNVDIVEAKRKVGTFNFHGCIKPQEN